jgi:hypothetical protein
MMHERGKSDSVVVADNEKPANKAEQSAVESEPRAGPEECEPAKHVPGAGPDNNKHVTGAGAHTASGKGKEKAADLDSRTDSRLLIYAVKGRNVDAR